MSRPVAIRRVIIELNLTNLSILRDALINYNKYLKDVEQFDNYTVLSKGAVKRRIKYTEDFIDHLEFQNV